MQSHLYGMEGEMKTKKVINNREKQENIKVLNVNSTVNKIKRQVINCGKNVSHIYNTCNKG